MRLAGWLLLVLGAALLPAAQGHALLLNGDFDELVPSNGTGGGWTSSVIDGSGGWQASGGSFDAHFILNDSGQLASDPTLEQTLTGLAIGTAYRITGAFESVYSGFGSPDALSFGVEVEGFPILELMRPEGVGSFSLDFVATATSHVLRLTAERNGDDSSYRVDRIALVPEPGVLLLLAAGLAGAALRRR